MIARSASFFHQIKFLSCTEVLKAAVNGKTDVFKFLKEECGFTKEDFCTIFSWKGASILFSILHAHTGKEVFSYFGIDSERMNLSKNFLTPALKGFSLIHVACLSLSTEALDASFQYEVFPLNLKAKHKDGTLWEPIDFVLYDTEEVYGPLSENEKRKVEILKLLITKGLSRSEALEAVQKKYPRLLTALYNKEERLLHQVLEHKNLLEKILRNKKRIPDDLGFIQTIRRNEITNTPPALAKEHLRELLHDIHYLNKANPIVAPLLATQLLALDSPEQTFSHLTTSLSEEKCTLFCSLLEMLEMIKNLLIQKDNNLQQFKEAERITVTFNNSSKKRAARSSSVPPCQRGRKIC